MTDSSAAQQDHSISDTLQSLVVAFVLAMAFRGFVLEGFIIPTGSMAPTLMGQHTRWHSRQTGYEFAFDATPNAQTDLARRGETGRDVFDPMLSIHQPQDRVTMRDLVNNRGLSPRMGDRILIIKTLFPFFQPQRFDVVVFKNPTDPLGDQQNYIKRLVGLPDEKVLFIDGDVFSGPLSIPGMDGYEVRRKPEHVQRAVWQPVHHSEYAVTDETSPQAAIQVPWRGEQWKTVGRRGFDCDTAEPTTLRWDHTVRPINDWTAYNTLIPLRPTFNVSDIRVSAGIVAQQPGLATALDIRTRGHLFQFEIANGAATARLRPLDQTDGWLNAQTQPVDLPPPGCVFQVEFWHVDQSMAIYVNGRCVVKLDYDWSPIDRLQQTTGKRYEPMDRELAQLANPRLYPPPQVSWSFRGSPVTLHRVHLDRDLFYQPIMLDEYQHPKPTHPDFASLVMRGQAGYGTAPSNPAQLGPDQFLMCGDNSPASHDSRAWRNPDPLVAHQIDPKPFVVNRKLLLGKAWMVYFPAPFRATENGPPVIPDFGRLRFIR